MNIDISSIPNNPGCYAYKNSKNIILYVGKAKNLKKRVSSYFKNKDLDAKTKVLVEQIDSVDLFITDTEVESLILENNLIKKHLPKYNILLKDSKRYAYIQLTNEEYPRLLLARKKEGEGTYFGPFVSGETRDYILDLIRKTFMIRTCKRLPKKECLRYHIKLCSAPCTNIVSKKEYDDQIKYAKLALKGQTSELIKSLKVLMKKRSDKQDFELALQLRNQIDAVAWLNEKQKMERNKTYNEDILNYMVKDGRVYLILFNIYKGILENKQTFEFDYKDNFLEQFIIQYYSENDVPRELILPESIEESLIQFLTKQREKKVVVTVPKIGEKKLLLKLVMKNIEISFFSNSEKLKDLQERLKLNDSPYVIECFDISHLSGTNTVASMVQFRNGQPDKSNYRRYKIRTVKGVDDFESIKEVVRRRYFKLKKENATFPNLVVIDGGKGQLTSAMQALKEIEVKLPVISLAKKLEEIYFPGSRFPLRLDHKTKALKLLQAIRDEAHRFAINYNRLLRKKDLYNEQK
jgi:excinuclease ABC subunit C